MKLARENPHKRDRYVTEHPDYANNHIYVIRGKSHIERGYKSTTTWLKQFFEEFNADKVIDQYYDVWQARKHIDYYGKSKEEIKQMWEDNRDDAATKGTHMHLQFELFENGETVEYVQELPQFLKWKDDYKVEAWRTEMTIYSPKHRIVGNVDFIGKVNGEWSIVDYKRAQPKYASFGKKCIGPMSKYDHNDATKHALQLEIYKKILEELYGLEIKNLYNLYIKEDGNYIFEERNMIDNIDEILAWDKEQKKKC